MEAHIANLQAQLAQVNDDLEEVLVSDSSFDARAQELAFLRSRTTSLVKKWHNTKAVFLGKDQLGLYERIVDFDKQLFSTARQIGVGCEIEPLLS